MFNKIKRKIEQMKFENAKKNASPYVKTCKDFNRCGKGSDGTCVGCNTWLQVNGIKKFTSVTNINKWGYEE